MVGKFGVPGVNGSGERLIGMCCELGLLIGNTCFMKLLILKYTWEKVEHCVVVDRVVMDYVIVPRHLEGRLLNVNVLRAVAGGMSDHYLVEGVMTVNEGFFKRERRNVREVVKVDELEIDINMGRYQDGR